MLQKLKKEISDIEIGLLALANRMLKIKLTVKNIEADNPIDSEFRLAALHRQIKSIEGLVQVLDSELANNELLIHSMCSERNFYE